MDRRQSAKTFGKLNFYEKKKSKKRTFKKIQKKGKNGRKKKLDKQGTFGWICFVEWKIKTQYASRGGGAVIITHIKTSGERC